MKRLLPSRLLPTSRPGIAAYSALLVGGVGAVLYIATRPETTTTAPSYDIVLPQRTTIEELGGWKRSSPIEDNPSFSYKDGIESVDIIVSQQPIPASFEGNVAGQVKQLSESFNATTVIEAGGTDVYIGKSARGPQWVIFAKNSTLVIMKSEKTIGQAAWVRYINNLVDPKSEQLPTF